MFFLHENDVTIRGGKRIARLFRVYYGLYNIFTLNKVCQAVIFLSTAACTRVIFQH